MNSVLIPARMTARQATRGRVEATRWRELCRAASQEQDPLKLLQLLREINSALIEHRFRAAQGCYACAGHYFIK